MFSVSFLHVYLVAYDFHGLLCAPLLNVGADPFFLLQEIWFLLKQLCWLPLVTEKTVCTLALLRLALEGICDELLVELDWV